MPPVAFESNNNINASPIAHKLRQRLFHYPGQTPVFDDIIRNFTSQTDNP
jgi:hypothetical protein